MDACGGMWYPGDRHHAPAVPGVTRCPLGGAHSAQRQPSGWLERTARSGSKSVRVLEEMTGQGGNQQNLRSSTSQPGTAVPGTAALTGERGRGLPPVDVQIGSLHVRWGPGLPLLHRLSQKDKLVPFLERRGVGVIQKLACLAGWWCIVFAHCAAWGWANHGGGTRWVCDFFERAPRRASAPAAARFARATLCSHRIASECACAAAHVAPLPCARHRRMHRAVHAVLTCRGGRPPLWPCAAGRVFFADQSTLPDAENGDEGSATANQNAVRKQLEAFVRTFRKQLPYTQALSFVYRDRLNIERRKSDNEKPMLTIDLQDLRQARAGACAVATPCDSPAHLSVHPVVTSRASRSRLPQGPQRGAWPGDGAVAGADAASAGGSSGECDAGDGATRGGRLGAAAPGRAGVPDQQHRLWPRLAAPPDCRVRHTACHGARHRHARPVPPPQGRVPHSPVPGLQGAADRAPPTGRQQVRPSGASTRSVTLSCRAFATVDSVPRRCAYMCSVVDRHAHPLAPCPQHPHPSPLPHARRHVFPGPLPRPPAPLQVRRFAETQTPGAPRGRAHRRAAQVLVRRFVWTT